MYEPPLDHRVVQPLRGRDHPGVVLREGRDPDPALLELLADLSRPPRIEGADPTEAEALITTAPERDRALWATAMYAGLRRGELQALHAGDVDLAAGVIRVERGWDEKEGEIELKSNAGRRRVPIAAVLRDHLLEHKIATGREGDELIFGRTASDAFNGKVLQDRADEAWTKAGLTGSPRTSAATPSPR